MITAPRVQDAQLQKTIDHYASLVNVQAANWNAAVSREQSQPEVSPPRERQDMSIDTDVVMADVTQGEDKENWVGVDVVPRERRMDRERSGGLGFGSSVPMSREVGNTVYMPLSASPEKIKPKEKQRGKLSCGVTRSRTLSFFLP